MKKRILYTVSTLAVLLVILCVYATSAYRIEKIQMGEPDENGIVITCMALSPGCGVCPATEFAGYCFTKL